MAKDTQLSTETVNAQADAMARLLDNGYRRIYDGTKPATSNTELSGNTQLGELRFANPCAPAASNGLLTFTLNPDTSADNDGTATWYRDFKADGTSPVLDGTVGVTGSTSNMELNSTTTVTGQQIAVTSATHQVAKATTGL